MLAHLSTPGAIFLVGIAIIVGFALMLVRAEP